MFLNDLEVFHETLFLEFATPTLPPGIRSRKNVAQIAIWDHVSLMIWESPRKCFLQRFGKVLHPRNLNLGSSSDGRCLKLVEYSSCLECWLLRRGERDMPKIKDDLLPQTGSAQTMG